MKTKTSIQIGLQTMSSEQQQYNNNLVHTFPHGYLCYKSVICSTLERIHLKSRRRHSWEKTLLEIQHLLFYCCCYRINFLLFICCNSILSKFVFVCFTPLLLFYESVSFFFLCTIFVYNMSIFPHFAFTA